MIKKVLITGGLGYIGGRISSFLSKSKLYQLSIGTRDYRQSKPDWLSSGELVNLDISEQGSLEEACSGVHTVIHLAATNEFESALDPVHALDINSIGSLKLLNVAINAGVQRFIYISTAHVYGSPLTGLLTEKSFARPQHPYAITHKTAEDFILAAHDKGQINSVVLRLSNGFGCPERASVNRWTLLVNDLCKQAITTGKIVLNSSGIQTRDFISLEDVSRAVEHVLNMPENATADGLFNLGGENSMKIIDIADKIVECSNVVLNLKLAIKHPEPKAGETSLNLDYCIDKLKSTGYTLTSNMSEEIDNTLKLCVDSFEFGVH